MGGVGDYSRVEQRWGRVVGTAQTPSHNVPGKTILCMHETPNGA